MYTGIGMVVSEYQQEIGALRLNFCTCHAPMNCGCKVYPGRCHAPMDCGCKVYPGRCHVLSKIYGTISLLRQLCPRILCIGWSRKHSFASSGVIYTGIVLYVTCATGKMKDNAHDATQYETVRLRCCLRITSFPMDNEMRMVASKMPPSFQDSTGLMKVNASAASPDSTDVQHSVETPPSILGDPIMSPEVPNIVDAHNVQGISMEQAIAGIAEAIPVAMPAVRSLHNGRLNPFD